MKTLIFVIITVSSIYAVGKYNPEIIIKESIQDLEKCTFGRFDGNIIQGKTYWENYVNNVIMKTNCISPFSNFQHYFNAALKNLLGKKITCEHAGAYIQTQLLLSSEKCTEFLKACEKKPLFLSTEYQPESPFTTPYTFLETQEGIKVNELSIGRFSGILNFYGYNDMGKYLSFPDQELKSRCEKLNKDFQTIQDIKSLSAELNIPYEKSFFESSPHIAQNIVCTGKNKEKEALFYGFGMTRTLQDAMTYEQIKQSLIKSYVTDCLQYTGIDLSKTCLNQDGTPTEKASELFDKIQEIEQISFSLPQ